ncbi:MAG: PKD domain-containing protein [Bacteroidia bacterium]|nr:PKD domain-containing protein [Bacteroidia bacterium]
MRDNGSGTNPTFTQSADTVCLGASVTFTSSLPGAANYAWDFGGGASPVTAPTAQTTQITANTPGNFTITHRTYSPCCGWSDPFRRTLVILPTPPPTITIQTANGSTTTCTAEPVTFIAQLQNFAPNPTISWLVNGVAQGSGSTFVLNNPQSAVQVQAVATGNTPCSHGQPISSNAITLTVHPLPQVQYSGTSCISISGSPVPGELLTLSAAASGGSAPYIFYWDLGDGRGAVGNPATVMYPASGTYQIKLTVVDANGCRSTATPCETTLVVAQRPLADFGATPMQGCPPLTVSFTNLSAYANAYRWDFGDGTPISTQTNPIHVYRTSGEYTVTLYAISANANDTAIRQTQVVVYPVPVADFSVFPPILYEGDTAFFVSQSQGANSWLWLFGDPANPTASSTESDPSYYYSQPGRYTVTLIVENLYGCRDTITKSEAVIKLPNPAPASLAAFPREGIRVFPNPFTESVQVLLPGEASIVLYDSQGALLRRGTFAKGLHTLSLRELAAGIYFLRVGPYAIKLQKIG